MRNSINITSIASVVSRVIASVADAGVVRTFLQLTSMRELMGLWQEYRQPGFAAYGSHFGDPWACPLSGDQPGSTCHLRQYGMVPLAVSTAPNRFVSARASDLG